MKLIKFKEYGIKYFISDIKLDGKTFRSGYDKDLHKLLRLWKETKFSHNLIEYDYKTPFDAFKIWEVEFNEIEDLLELVPEEFL